MAENNNTFTLFGWEIKRSKPKKDTSSPSIVPPNDPDGAGYITSASPAGGYFGQYVDIDGDKAKDNHQLIMKYRGISMHPEVDMAIEEIVNEAITMGDNESQLNLVLDEIETTDKIKDTIHEEFDRILTLMNFKNEGQDIFRRWYVDGRLVHHVIIDEASTKMGIKELRYLDSPKVRKMKEIQYEKDPQSGVRVVKSVDEYFLYQDRPGVQNTGIKLTPDSVSYGTSGLLDESRKKVLSYLHKALKPVNQLRMMEDSMVIYRMSRAPERRIFYIDVGNLPKGKADEYMKQIMTKYRNKLVYDISTGDVKDDRKHMSMLEDFWLPRKEGGRGTEISSLPGGQNLGEIDDVIYFQKRLYRSLNVPINRLEQEAQFSLGRSTEITRDEVKFQKFINKLRRRFSMILIELLHKQLLLKKIITEQDWEEWKNEIIVDFVRDNHFSELKDNDILRERVQTLDMLAPHVGEFFTKDYIYKKVLHYTDEEIKELEKEQKENPPEEMEGEEVTAAPKPAPAQPRSKPKSAENVDKGEK